MTAPAPAPNLLIHDTPLYRPGDGYRPRQPIPPPPRSPEEAVAAIARWTEPLTFLLEGWIGEPVVMRTAIRQQHHQITAAESALLHVPEGTPAWYRLGSMVPASWGTREGVLPVALTGLLLLPCRLPKAVVDALDGGEPLGRVLAREGRESGMPVSRVHHRERVTAATKTTAATAETSALMYLGAALVALAWEKLMPWLWGGSSGPKMAFEDVRGPSEFNGFPRPPERRAAPDHTVLP